MKGTRLTDRIYNEIILLGYSLRMLIGRNLLAVGIITAFVLLTVLSDPVSIRQNRLAILLKQLELFAPLLGIVIFSDLIAGDVQAKRASLLMCSRSGIVPVVTRKLLHGLLITSASYGLILLVLRSFFTSFDLLSAFAIVIPGALYFGMIGLLAATFTSQPLAGYATGTGALILSMVIKQAMPLVPTAYQMKRQLATATLFADQNWVFAKLLFVILAALLALLVVFMARRRSQRVPILAFALLLLGACYSVVHIQWARKVQPDIRTGPSKQVAVIQQGDVLTVRTAAVTTWGKPTKKKNEETLLKDTTYGRDNGEWVQQQEIEYDPALEYDLVHLDIDANVAPTSAALDAKVTADIRVRSPELNKLYLHLAWECQVQQAAVNGTDVAFSRYGDLVEIPLTEPVAKDQILKLDLSYAGTLRIPGFRMRSEHYDGRVFFVSTRWYPFTKTYYHAGQRDLCTYDVRIGAPKGWQVSGAQRIAAEGDKDLWRLGTHTPSDRIALMMNRFPRVETQFGDIQVTVSSHSMKTSYMQEIAERACDALRYYESAFGPYPHHHLEIVEYDYISAGGIAVPSLVLMNTRRCRPELKWDMLNMYIPHEVAHQWFSSALPSWIAEGSAVYANYLYLAQRDDHQGLLPRFHKGFNDAFQADKDSPCTLVDARGLIPYIKGGYFMMMLTSVHKTRTVDALSAFIQTQNRLQSVDLPGTNERFIQAMAQAGGPELETFVSDWTRSSHKFDPAVTAFTQAQGSKGFKVRAALAQEERIRFPVPLRIAFTDGTQLDTTWQSTTAKQTMEWTFDKPVQSLTLDPDSVLLDWNRYNNVRGVSNASSDRAPQAQPVALPQDSYENWATYTVGEGLLTNDVRFVKRTADGQVLAGLQLRSNASGTYMQCFDGQWTQPDALSFASGPITAATAQADGSLWAAHQGRLRRIRNGRATTFTTTQYREYNSFAVGKAHLKPNPEANCTVPGCVVYDMSTDQQDRVWLATDNGISIIDSNARLIKHMTIADGLPGNEVLCMSWQDQDTLWVGTDQGCASYDQGTWTVVDRCPRDIIPCVTTDTQGNVYIGTYRHGLYAYSGKQAERFHAFNSPLPHDMVTALTCDAQGRLWVGTGRGLWCRDGKEDQVYTHDNSGLLSSRIAGLTTDGQYLWIATHAGIARFDLTPESLVALVEN